MTQVTQTKKVATLASNCPRSGVVVGVLGSRDKTILELSTRLPSSLTWKENTQLFTLNWVK